VSDSDALSHLIRDQIQRGGPVSFAWFMDQALYHPLYGYYSSENTRIGKAGDFFTNVSVGDLFGRILAGQFVELFELLATADGFKLVEQGAENAQLAKDVLQALASEPKSAGWEYWIVERFAKKIAQQNACLGTAPIPVRWIPDLQSPSSISGIIFCNELLDALPCHLIEHDGEKWWEIRVGEKGGIFDFVRVPIQDETLAGHVARLPTPSITPYRSEVNLAALRWMRSAARALTRGFILIIDYGFPQAEYYSPARTEGTLTGYYRHQRQNAVLQRPGKIDITAHVDFTAIAQAALSGGCRLLGFTDQHHFMVGAAEPRLREIELLASRGSMSEHQRRFLREYKSLMHPHTMGLAFKYLLLGKGVSPTQLPSGFKYSRDPAVTLHLDSARGEKDLRG
jgi:SAM-dependent MidA family methyltransferase